MADAPAPNVRLETVLRQDRGRLLAALIATLGNFELAEDALSDAVESALIHWVRSDVPENPGSWLLKVARRKAIDRIRRQKRFQERLPELTHLAKLDELDGAAPDHEIPDERLRLIFTCCHPALEPKTRVALTLRTLGGLNTGEIARAFLDRESAMGQRLSRARKKIARAGIPFAIPSSEEWADRLDSVLTVIYLIFNEGYRATSGSGTNRTNLCGEAIYLARTLNELRPNEPEILGLLSLVLTTHARHSARRTEALETIPLDKQNRELWDDGMISEGIAVLDRAILVQKSGPFQIKAAISALHASASRDAETDWNQIALLYDALMQFEPTAVVALNGAVARAEAGNIKDALATFDRLQADLSAYQPFYAARAEYLARAGRLSEAAQAYDQAIQLTGNSADRAFLTARRSRLSH